MPFTPACAKARFDRTFTTWASPVAVAVGASPAEWQQARAIVRTDWQSLSEHFGQELAAGPQIDGVAALFIMDPAEYGKVVKGAALVHRNVAYSVNAAKPFEPGGLLICHFLLGVRATNLLPGQ